MIFPFPKGWPWTAPPSRGHLSISEDRGLWFLENLTARFLEPVQHDEPRTKNIKVEEFIGKSREWSIEKDCGFDMGQAVKQSKWWSYGSSVFVRKLLEIEVGWPMAEVFLVFCVRWHAMANLGSRDGMGPVTSSRVFVAGWEVVSC